MAKGKIKRVANIDQKFGANAEYLFLKVQADWNADAEEYLLLTDHEYDEALERSDKNPEDLPSLSRGEFTRVDNTQRKFGADSYYVAIRVKPEAGGKWATLLFTEEGLDRIRERVQKNAEDIEANRESWLADLFD
jgi:hypothetical protein